MRIRSSNWWWSREKRRASVAVAEAARDNRALPEKHGLVVWSQSLVEISQPQGVSVPCVFGCRGDEGTRSGVPGGVGEAKTVKQPGDHARPGGECFASLVANCGRLPRGLEDEARHGNVALVNAADVKVEITTIVIYFEINVPRANSPTGNGLLSGPGRR